MLRRPKGTPSTSQLVKRHSQICGDYFVRELIPETRESAKFKFTRVKCSCSCSRCAVFKGKFAGNLNGATIVVQHHSSARRRTLGLSSDSRRARRQPLPRAWATRMRHW